MNTNLTSCKIASRLMSDSFERKLSMKERLALKLHLMMCKGCTIAFKQFKGLQSTLCKYTIGISQSTTPKNKSLSPEAKKRIKDKLSEK